MTRQDAEQIITEYLKPIFGFALKRCKSTHDAEDLSQEIVLRAFRALLIKDDIEDMGKFIWTIAHNTLSNYYRDAARGVIGVPVEEFADVLPDPDSLRKVDDNTDAIRRLQSEIAYLSRLQRKIVIAYYFENRKQADIAKDLDIPLGTVKWHLFEAKKELKRGMDTMRKTSDLKFNPIQFDSLAINGSCGTKNMNELFRSTLVQNICYCVRNEAKTVNEIADDLGVSPVYVENEVASLEEYCYLKKQQDKYILNFLISEPTAELLTMKDAMYKKAAASFANDLYDELIASGLLEHPDILCGQTDGPITLTESPRADRNFLLWTLIPYIISEQDNPSKKNKISFKETATLRPDGAHNITRATVVPEHMVLPDDYVYMKNWCGPYRFDIEKDTAFWQLDTEWSERRIVVDYSSNAHTERLLSLYERECKGERLSKDEYAWLSECGYIKTVGDYDGARKAVWQIVTLASKDIRKKLLTIGEKLQAKYADAFEALGAPYADALLATVPPHLRKMEEYELQFLFCSDGWFLLHCLVVLLNNGKLKIPSEGQKKALTTLLISK